MEKILVLFCFLKKSAMLFISVRASDADLWVTFVKSVSIISGMLIQARKAYEPNVIEVTDSESGVKIDLRGH